MVTSTTPRCPECCAMFERIRGLSAASEWQHKRGTNVVEVEFPLREQDFVPCQNTHYDLAQFHDSPLFRLLAQLVRDETSLCVQGTDEWKERRHCLVTGSVINCVSRNDYFKKPEELIYERAMSQLGLATGAAIPSEAMEWGNRYESEALDAYLDRSGHIALANLPLIECPKHRGVVGSSPDGITLCGIVIEIKCPYSTMVERQKWTFRTPRVDIDRRYIGQVLMEMYSCHTTRAAFIRYRPAGFGPKGQVIKGEPMQLSINNVNSVEDVASMLEVYFAQKGHCRDEANRLMSMVDQIVVQNAERLDDEGKIRRLIQLWIEEHVIPLAESLREDVDVVREDMRCWLGL